MSTNILTELGLPPNRQMCVGKHEAVTYAHLRKMIEKSQQAGLQDVADTLIWHAWHHLNDSFTISWLALQATAHETPEELQP